MVVGVHFNSKKIIRRFCSKRITMRQCDPHVVQYTDLTTQGKDHFACKGLVHFRARHDGKYQRAIGVVNIPKRRQNKKSVVRRVRFRWTRISEEEQEAAIGKRKFESIEDIFELIWSNWKVQR